MVTQSHVLERPKKPLIIISSHDFNSNDHGHPIELDKDKCRVLIEYKSKTSYSKERLGHCLDQNYMEEQTTKD